jgi:hypothetical protein
VVDVDRQRQAATAATFLARHRAPPVLSLPNAWDAMSARIFIAAGFDALATTSGGVAWALGYPDGEAAPWAEVVTATARIVRAAQVAVTADIETGYGATPAEVATHVAEMIEAGVVGVNLEDGLHGSIRSIEDATARLRAARAGEAHPGDRCHKRRQPYQRRLPHRSRQLPSPRTSSRQPRSRIISCALKMPGRQKDAGGLCGLDDQYRRL